MIDGSFSINPWSSAIRPAITRKVTRGMIAVIGRIKIRIARIRGILLRSKKPMTGASIYAMPRPIRNGMRTAKYWKKK